MDFMSKQVLFVRADDTLDQAEKTFHDNQLATAPVLVDKKNLMGVLTDFQLVKCFLLRNLRPSKARVQDYEGELDPVVMVDQHEPLETAFKLMVQSPSHRLYITDNGHLVGALSPQDLLPFLAGDTAVERFKENKDLIDARIRIKSLFKELSHTKNELSNYSSVFKASPFMIHSVNLQGVITMANPMLHSVLGYDERELIGKNIYDLYAEQFHRQAAQGLQEVVHKGYYPMINTLMVKKNKELLQVDIATSAKHDSSGAITGTVTISRLSDARKMLDALAHAAANLHELVDE